MGMINIISPDQKRLIRAARINVVLVRYAIMLISLALIIGMIYSVGFWLVHNEEAAIKEKLASQSQQSKAYDDVEKKAQDFRKNLSVAKSILSKETSYSTFLTTLASSLPDGTIIVNLSLGGATTQQGLNIDSRAASYAKILELKSSLEASELFENVSIVSASRPDDISTLDGLEKKYPYEASFNVKLSTVPTSSGAKS
jgi:Tfp pilus assembly protein PilN